MPFDRHIIDKLKGNSDERDGIQKQHRREEKGIKVGRLSHGYKSAVVSALLEEFMCEIFERSQYSPDLHRVKSLVPLRQEISGRPEDEV